MPDTEIKLNQTVKTPDIGRYFNLGTPSTPEWEFAGTGFNSMGENPQAQKTDTQYISDRTGTSDIDSYQPQWAFDTDLIKNQKCIMKLYDIGYYRKTGADAQFELLLVDLFQPVEESPNTFKARRQIVSCEISGFDGEAGKTLHVTGNLNAVGDQIVGTFNTTTKAFTADSEVPTP